MIVNSRDFDDSGGSEREPCPLLRSVLFDGLHAAALSEPTEVPCKAQQFIYPRKHCAELVITCDYVRCMRSTLIDSGRACVFKDSPQPCAVHLREKHAGYSAHEYSLLQGRRQQPYLFSPPTDAMRGHLDTSLDGAPVIRNRGRIARTGT